MTAWIDLDIVLYKGLFVTEGLNYYAQIRACDNILGGILDRLDPDDFSLVITGPGNFRKKLDQTYKANRTQPGPRYLHDAKQYFIKYWNAVRTTGIEADDLIATSYLPNDVIVTTDKDFLQIQGATIYNPTKDETTVVTDGMKFFFTQMLAGDPVDNVIGILNPEKSHHKTPPKFSMTTADKLLDGKSTKEMAELVLSLYNNQYQDSGERFDINANLLWLLRGVNDSYKLHI